MKTNNNVFEVNLDSLKMLGAAHLVRIRETEDADPKLLQAVRLEIQRRGNIQQFQAPKRF